MEIDTATLPFDLTGRVALVTGGSRGLGHAMARGLAAAGATTILLARSETELTRAKAALEKVGGPIYTLVSDLSHRSAAAEAIGRAAELAGPIDILLHDAGSSHLQPVDAIDDASWDGILELDLSAAMALTRAVVPGMRAKRAGRIIYISSTFGEVSLPGRGSYSAAKAGLRGFARGAALDLGPDGITVNCIAPGPFRTELTEAAGATHNLQAFSDATALGRWGRPEELAGVVVLLASDAGSYITGTTLFVDGGYTAR
ncbi:SDR family NAD(P)-dependent oxidoreductase [Leifsonia shinshuensis]|uniref:SDR family NAD(P)-dependent oxidoreductase n=1 Tax=Leifsonia shinshuensis TaxID=150026 RepID=UPI00285E6D88|nr:SDR family NAD(P)-dependent oxidoreductase [Leifsonia shinshuensis]MDR6972713.1 NAD(P)-dependent dehydrogenase (short-subunit alcohol dehydrogenase family) [Leifsonia shinshuensis]